MFENLCENVANLSKKCENSVIFRCGKSGRVKIGDFSDLGIRPVGY